MTEYNLLCIKDSLKNVRLNDILYLRNFVKNRISYLNIELNFYNKINFNLNSHEFLINLDIKHNLLNSINKLKKDLLLINSILHCFYHYGFLSLFYDPDCFCYDVNSINWLFSEYNFILDFKKNLFKPLNKQNVRRSFKNEKNI